MTAQAAASQAFGLAAICVFKAIVSLAAQSEIVCDSERMLAS